MPHAAAEPSLSSPEDDQPDALGQGPFERAYRGLMRGLYEGRYVPGQRLAAPDLMAQFDVGRGTIREVLHRLASNGVVTIVPNRGATVRMLTRRETSEILDLVQLMLGFAAHQAATRITTSEDADLLRSQADVLRAHEGGDDLPSFVRAREDFYRCVMRLSGNHELQRVFPTIQVHIFRTQLRHFPRAAESMQFPDFSELAAAILAGDARRAEAAARDHVHHTIESVASLPDRAFAPER